MQRTLCFISSLPPLLDTALLLLSHTETFIKCTIPFGIAKLQVTLKPSSTLARELLSDVVDTTLDIFVICDVQLQDVQVPCGVGLEQLGPIRWLVEASRHHCESHRVEPSCQSIAKSWNHTTLYITVSMQPWNHTLVEFAFEVVHGNFTLKTKRLVKASCHHRESHRVQSSCQRATTVNSTRFNLHARALPNSEITEPCRWNHAVLKSYHCVIYSDAVHVTNWNYIMKSRLKSNICGHYFDVVQQLTTLKSCICGHFSLVLSSWCTLKSQVWGCHSVAVSVMTWTILIWFENEMM